MKFSIIIPTYNHCDDLLKPCINSILATTDLKQTETEIVISANGCFDNTAQYLSELHNYFAVMGMPGHLKTAWSDIPTGYAKATNDGIKICSGERIILLNNDVLLLPQPTNDWIYKMNRQFEIDEKCGISGPSKVFSDPAGRDFLIFFCVMIDRRVFDTLGLLNEEYGKGGGEDTEFCALAEDAGFHLNGCVEQIWNPELQLYVGDFPIYHRGEGTVHDINLVPDYSEVFETNSWKLGKKFNSNWYRWKLSNNLERGVYMRGHHVDLREKQRYSWAANRLAGLNVLDIGCSSGYGAQFFPINTNYTGIDYDARIVEVANAQNWLPGARFIHADLSKFEEEFENVQFDTILAFEVIEHLKNGLEFVEILKRHCQHIVISVPFDESPAVINPHHLLRNLHPEHFKNFNLIGFININGDIIQESELSPNTEYSLLLEWRFNPKTEFDYLKDQHAEIYNEISIENVYNLTRDLVVNKNVIDIGANNGLFSILCSAYGANKVIAVEPVSTTYKQLIENLNKTDQAYKVLPLKNVVTDNSGDFINIGLHENSGHNSLYNVDDKFETVESITLTDIFKNFDQNDIFLKLDCEGAEYDILLNATDEEFKRISNIVLEIHSELHPTYKGAEILENKLKSSGFTLVEKKQTFLWMYGPGDQLISSENLPYATEIWKRTIQIQPAEEFTWMKTNHGSMYREIIVDNAYEINREMINGREVLDIGANVGTFSLLTGFYGAKKVVSVEPVFKTFNYLVNNIKQSKIKSIKPIKKIVSNVAGNFIDIGVNEDSGFDSLYWKPGNVFEAVETTTLSELLTEFDSDDIFLKLDCEGAEYDILMNATKEEMNRISNVTLEIHMEYHPAYKGSAVIENKLNEFGFTKITDHQIATWNSGPNGEMFNYKEIPFKVQMWRK